MKVILLLVETTAQVETEVSNLNKVRSPKPTLDTDIGLSQHHYRFETRNLSVNEISPQLL